MIFAVRGFVSSTLVLRLRKTMVSITHVVAPTIANLTNSRWRMATSR